MGRAWTCMAAVAASVMLSSAAFADLSAEQTRTAEGLIKQFAAPEFTARQQAVDKLIEMGPDVAPLVKKTLAATGDNEVKLRCQLVMKGLAAKYGTTPEGNAGKPQDFGPSLITLDEKETPIYDVLQLLADKSGNAPILQVDANRGGRMLMMAPKPMIVTISVKDKPYWEVLDEICLQTGLCYDLNWDARSKVRLRLAMAEAPDKSCCSGPVVVKVDSVQRSETVTGYVHYRNTQNDPIRKVDRQVNTYMQVRYFIEDRLPILSSALEFTRAMTPDGIDHMPPGMREQFRMNRRFSNNNGNGPWSGQTQFYLQGADAQVDKPLTLEGKVSFEAAVGRKEFKIPGLRLDAAPAEKSMQGDGFEIRLTGVQKQGFNITITCEISADAGVPIFTGGTASAFGFSLVDAKGKVYKDVTQANWSSPRGGMSNGGGPNGFRLDQAGEPGKAIDGKLTLTLSGVRTAEGDWSLGLSMPERIDIRDIPFKIKDIEMPKVPPAVDAPKPE